MANVGTRVHLRDTRRELVPDSCQSPSVCPDVLSGSARRLQQAHAPIALTGTVVAKVDAGLGAIRVGDLLSASPTPGQAMRADDPAHGTIVGKVLEPLDTGTGLIKVLVMLR